MPIPENIDHKTIFEQLNQADQNQLMCWLSFRGFKISEATITQLMGGLSNHNFKLDWSDQSYFLQIRSGLHQPLLNYIQQQHILNDQALSDWLPETECVGEKFLIQNFVDSRGVLTLDHVQASLQFVSMLSELHQSTIHLPSIDMSLYIESLYERAHLASQTNRSLEPIARQSLLLAQEFVAVCPCHNDLNPQNLLWDDTSGQLKVIDWEYASISDPCFEWAVIICEHQLRSAVWQPLVAEYQRRSPIEVSADKLQKMCQLYQGVRQLWQVAQS